jgi:xanthine dehydrogenase molybdopterin-binding subunit B
MGGGFGGKETQAGHIAVWAALAARKTKRPVKMRLDRDDDFMVTGKRHPFRLRLRVGFDGHGLITGLKLMLAANCGWTADLSGPVADRAVFHADNATSSATSRSFPTAARPTCRATRPSAASAAAGHDRDRGDPRRHRAHAGKDALDVRMRTCTESPSATSRTTR